MEHLQVELKKLIELMNFGDFSTSYDEENGRFLVFINEGDYFKKFLPYFVEDLNRLFRLIASKKGVDKPVFVDINNYRREREVLILEIARVAAKKAATIKEGVALPPMNAYDRRLIHMELSSRPDVKTESVGIGKGRYIIIRPVN